MCFARSVKVIKQDKRQEETNQHTHYFSSKYYLSFSWVKKLCKNVKGVLFKA